MITELFENNNVHYRKVSGYKEIMKWIYMFKKKLDKPDLLIAMDIETKYLNLEDNKLLGFGICYAYKKSAYFVTRDLSIEQIRNIFTLINSFLCKIVYHNVYFDVSQLKYLLGIDIKWDYCTYIIAHSIHSDILYYKHSEEDISASDSLSLKSLVDIYSPYLSNYEDTLEIKKKEIIAKLHIKTKKFTYDLFDDDDLFPYACGDVLATWDLCRGLLKDIKIRVQEGWEGLVDLIKLKHDVTKIYIDAKVIGVRIDRDMIMNLYNDWKPRSEALYEEILQDEDVKQAESFWFMKKIQNAHEKLEEGKSLTQRTINRMREECKFNVKSSTQKKILFFEVMGLEPLEYNPPSKTTGQRSPKTDKEFLQAYSFIPIIDKMRQYQLLTKGIDGFLGVDDESKEKGLWNLTSDAYPITHPNSNLQGTLTHRIAQNSPNFQQYASRGELSEMKKCIIPRYDNHRLVAFDYSSAELYILGALADETNFKNAIHNNLDLHSSTAYNIWKEDMKYTEKEEAIIVDKIKELKNELKECSGDKREKIEKDLEYFNNLFRLLLPYRNEFSLAEMDIDEQTKMSLVSLFYGKTFRYNAKAINFGMPYGIGISKLSKNIGKSTKEGRDTLNRYKETNKHISDYMDLNKDLLSKYGYIEGTHNQRVYLKYAFNFDWRKFEKKKFNNPNAWKALAELRKSTNYIIQSENALVLYESLVSFSRELEEKNLKDKIVFLLSVYDAVYLSVDNSISDSFINNLLKKHFEVPYKNGISFKIDISSGTTMKEL